MQMKQKASAPFPPLPEAFADMSIDSATEKAQAQQQAQAQAQAQAQPQQAHRPTPAGPTFTPEMNCPQEYLSMSVNAIPATAQLLTKSALPVGCVIHPLITDAEIPVVSFSGKIVRCRVCRTYINPFVQWTDHGHRWRCNMCDFINDVGGDYYSPLSVTSGLRRDINDRPELKSGYVEFIAPSEYMVRPPMPPVFFFVIDVSYQSVASGMLATVASSVRRFVNEYHENPRTRFGVVTFDNTVHFYNLKSSLSQPQMLTVPDLQNMLLPVPEDELLVNLSESKQVVLQLLEKLPKMFAGSQQVGCAFGSAVQAAAQVTKRVGGKLLCFLTGLPTHGEGKLNRRDDAKLLGTDREHTLLCPADPGDFYKSAALELSRLQVTADLFVCTSTYVDLSTVGLLPQITGGQVYYYSGFAAQRHATRLSDDLLDNLTRTTAWEAVFRVRCSKGLRVHAHFGHFFIRSTDLLALPTVDTSKSFGIQLSVVETITQPQAYIQSALLYTTSAGERRIRVFTSSIPVVSTIAALYSAVNEQTLVDIVARMAIEKLSSARLSDTREAIVRKLIDLLTVYRSQVTPSGGALPLPEQMANAPLYTLALVKHPAFRGGSDTRPDERAAQLAVLRVAPVDEACVHMHPRLICLSPGSLPSGDTDPATMPTPLALSSAQLDPRGVFLFEDAQSVLLLVGRATGPQLLGQLFGVEAITDVDTTMTTLPEVDNDYNRRVRAIVAAARARHAWPLSLQVCREDVPAERALVVSRLVSDHSHGFYSYHEFIAQLQRQLSLKSK
eukprot:TRINITY_DN1246_c3_g1_i1.p1 TRINITY_DN1246_c3_g1~~TRINITY_DN1246_c3_g1_i1.p1  ORF type:complete len:909 (-),score=246.17 TRINITY_DN1246_c3_g1_i1:29-2374(-)